MGYFIPSFFQKRILYYALSKLDWLDIDALDLDKLDVVWGKRSTVELRDVGLRLAVRLCQVTNAALVRKDSADVVHIATSFTPLSTRLPSRYQSEDIPFADHYPCRHLQ